MHQQTIHTWLLSLALLSINMACTKEQDLTAPDQAYLEIPDKCKIEYINATSGKRPFT